MSLHYDVVDGDVNEFDKKANEAHDSKTNSSGKGNLLKFCKKNEMIHYHAQKWKLLLWFKAGCSLAIRDQRILFTTQNSQTKVR